MEIATTIWLLTKWLLLIAVAGGLLVGLIALFHPLRFNLHLRGSMRGQRAELWFVYLFRIFRLGIVASPHTQDIVLQIFFWKRVLQRNQRAKPKKDAPTDSPTSPQVDDLPKSPAEQRQDVVESPKEVIPVDETRPLETVAPESEPEPESKSEAKSESEPEPKSEPESKSDSEPEPESETEQASPVEEMPKPASQVGDTEEISTAEPISAEPSTGKAPTKIEKIDTIDPFSQKTDFKQDSSEESTSERQTTGESDSWRKRLRLLRKRIADKYREGKKWLRLFGRKYKLLSPIFWKFYRRSRKGFRIDSPALLCRYALHEPYLTGMCQGNLAIFSGMLQRFGIDFVPVPVFTGPTLYSKAKASLVLMPWRFVFAVFALFFDKILWQEAWKLFKWYRARKTVSTT